MIPKAYEELTVELLMDQFVDILRDSHLNILEDLHRRPTRTPVSCFGILIFCLEITNVEENHLHQKDKEQKRRVFASHSIVHCLGDLSLPH